MKTLIVYYSFTHNNEMLAKVIQARLSCDVHRIEEVTKRTGLKIMLDLMFNRKPRIKSHPYSISSYEQCIFVSPVWAGKIATPLKTFLMQEKRNIKRYSFITVCGGGAPQQRENLAANMAELVGQAPVLVQELWISDLLTEQKEGAVKYTSGYSIQPQDLEKFSGKIDEFLKDLAASHQVKQVVE